MPCSCPVGVETQAPRIVCTLQPNARSICYHLVGKKVPAPFLGFLDTTSVEVWGCLLQPHKLQVWAPPSLCCCGSRWAPVFLGCLLRGHCLNPLSHYAATLLVPWLEESLMVAFRPLLVCVGFQLSSSSLGWMRQNPTPETRPPQGPQCLARLPPSLALSESHVCFLYNILVF